MSTSYSTKSIIKVFNLIRRLVELNTKINKNTNRTRSIKTSTTTTTTTKIAKLKNKNKDSKSRERNFYNIRLIKSKLNKLFSKIKHYTKQNDQYNYNYFYNYYMFKCFNININCTKIKKSIYKCNNYFYSKCCCCNSCCNSRHQNNMCNLDNGKISNLNIKKKKFFELTDYHIANICIIIFVSTLYVIFFYR